MKARDLRELGAAELDQKIRELSQELNDLRIKHQSGAGVEKPVRMRLMRRDIARMKTVQTQREAK
ncbi:MAG: 50S ribosomal protein L29 [Kiritimatiellia bacterium]|jgi:large subunit ribosomal protein L29|nr:50S ribosomal protein L29 [Kiritimatiellia bacterium]